MANVLGTRQRSFYVSCYFLLLLVVGLLLYKDYGVAWDEPLDQMNGMVSAKYATTKIVPGWAMQQDSFKDTPDLYSFGDNDHGPLLEMTLSLIKLQLGITESRDYYLLRHLGLFLLFVLGNWMLYNIGRVRFRDWRIGLVLCTLLILSPRLFAESFYNVKDIGFLVLFTVGVYTLIRLLERPSLGRAVVHGLATAAALDLRILGLLLIGLTIGMVILEAVFGADEKATRGTLFKVMLVYFIVAAIGTVIGWPYLWEAPVDNFIHAFNNLKRYRWSGEVLYMGKISIAPELPWHYACVWILITTPIAYTFAFVIGATVSVYSLVRQGFMRVRTFEGRLDILFLGWFFLPVLMIIILDSVIYDGWRHLYFIYPGFLVLAMRGIVALGQVSRQHTWLKHITIFAALLAGSEMLYTVVRMVRSHPEQQVFFSFLPSATAEQLFERDYWGLSYRKGLEWLLEHEPTNTINIYGPNTLLLDNNLAILKPDDRARFKVTPSNKNRYFLGAYRTQNVPYADSLGWKVFQVESNGTEILAILHHP